MNYRTVKTSELRQGDVVNCHGLRLLIDRELQHSVSHPADARRGTTCFTQALVLNRDEVPTTLVPFGWTRDWQRNGKPAENGEHRWTIQGNDLAYWAVEEERA